MREAYKRAAEHIAAHIAEKGVTQVCVATQIGRDEWYVGRLLRWRDAGYPEGTTPFTMADPLSAGSARAAARLPRK